MTRRRLRPDEIDLWRKVTATTERLGPERKRDDPPLLRPKPPTTQIQRVEPFEFGAKAQGSYPEHDIMPHIRDHVALGPLNMDKKKFGKLKRGKLSPEGKLDLHGMTLDQAHPALIRFILGAQASGKRLVLVVTGKGKHRDEGGPIPTRLGVLRHNVPQWLSQTPLSQAVLQITQAHLRHGGDGAYYVYLRRGLQ